VKLIQTAARPMLAWVFIHSGADVLRNPAPRAQTAAPTLEKFRQLAPFLPDDDIALVRANAATQLVAGVALASGTFPRLAALALTGSIVPTTIAGHRFWALDDPAHRAQQRVQFNKNLAILGGLLFAAATERRRRH
jgi:uncharacterized membrane protein YphA (DoxX/SURF4 family)